ncbi:MAG: 50S ribosomal protein L22 [Patescibacteria group bacterium]|jgi:large subunit ribosomal protein L22
MEVTAKLRFLKISPRKVRLVTSLVAGKTVERAVQQLSFLTKEAALPVLKLIKSAEANAENNFKLSKDNLFIKRIFVDQGPVIKRWRARAFGRAGMIMKRSSHITVILDEQAGAGKKAKSKKAAAAGKKGVAKKVEKKIVDFKDIKHEAKGKKGQEESSEEVKKPSGSSFQNIKDKFTRRLGER